MIAHEKYETSKSGCSTCRGWSCMACVRAEDHDMCAMDCSNCYDPRKLPEEPWEASAAELREVITGRYSRSHHGQATWQAHRTHRLGRAAPVEHVN